MVRKPLCLVCRRHQPETQVQMKRPNLNQKRLSAAEATFIAGALSLVVASAGYCQDSEPGLRGLAEFSQVSAQAIDVTSRIIAGGGQSRFECVRLKVKNNGEGTVMVDGEGAVAQVEGRTVAAVGQDQAIKGSGYGLSLPSQALLAGASIGSLGLAGPILYEIMTNPRQKGFQGYEWGRDGLRNWIENNRFGRSIILPGDERIGWMCFDCAAGRVPTKVQIPISSIPDNGQSGQLVVDVPATAQPASIVKPGSRAGESQTPRPGRMHPGPIAP